LPKRKEEILTQRREERGEKFRGQKNAEFLKMIKNLMTAFEERHIIRSVT
jgi:hypothetical protein